MALDISVALSPQPFGTAYGAYVLDASDTYLFSLRCLGHLCRPPFDVSYKPRIPWASTDSSLGTHATALSLVIRITFYLLLRLNGIEFAVFYNRIRPGNSHWLLQR